LNLGDLNQVAELKLGLSEPRTNYSGLTGTLGTEKFPGAAKFGTGKFKDKFIRNLSQLEEASPVAHEAGVRLATSNAQASALINAAVPQIEKILGKDGPTWEDLRKAYIESRLRGIRERWGKMAAQSSVATPAQLVHMLGKWGHGSAEGHPGERGHSSGRGADGDSAAGSGRERKFTGVPDAAGLLV
jgi:hypothetical protein